jgi:hypothetical protein
MKLLKSQKFQLPKVFFVTDISEIKDIPIGVPFIFGDASDEEYLVRILEYEVLYKSALKTGYPFNFKKILMDAGYIDLVDHNYTSGTAPIIDFSSEKWDDEVKTDKDYSLYTNSSAFKSYIRDSAVYVDLDKLKDLNVFPIWVDKIEDAISTNIHNFATFNPNMYNKKLEGMYGGLELTSPGKNLIIIDISGSIPKAVSSTCLVLAKNLAESFYADLLITGSKSILYPYEQIHELDIQTIYEMGTNNDQIYFKELLSSEKKHYKTAIVFGDNDHPGHNWWNDYPGKTVRISDKDGKKLCKWEIDKLISFHTSYHDTIAGYGRWFSPKEIEHVSDWVEYLN